MLKKRIIILLIFIISMTFIIQIQSFTLAKVESSASINITDSDNALIAVMDDTDLNITRYITNTITQTLLDFEEPSIEQVSSSEVELIGKSYLEIKNNMNNSINVSVYFDGAHNGIELIDNSSKSILPGETIKISYRIGDEIMAGNYDLDLKIFAKWGDGSAVINKTINVMVEESNITCQNLIDLRTPAKNIIPISNDEYTKENNIEISTDSKENNENIVKDECITETINENINTIIEKQENINNQDMLDFYTEDNLNNSVISDESLQ